MKKYVLKLLTLGLVIISCLAFAGCGSNAGNKYIGTWADIKVLENGSPSEQYILVEKNKNIENGYIINEYYLTKSGWTGQLTTDHEQYNATLDDKGLLVKDGEHNFYIDNSNKLRGNQGYGKNGFNKLSDKSITFDEMNKDRGFPEPK